MLAVNIDSAVGSFPVSHFTVGMVKEAQEAIHSLSDATLRSDAYLSTLHNTFCGSCLQPTVVSYTYTKTQLSWVERSDHALIKSEWVSEWEECNVPPHTDILYFNYCATLRNVSPVGRGRCASVRWPKVSQAVPWLKCLSGILKMVPGGYLAPSIRSHRLIYGAAAH